MDNMLNMVAMDMVVMDTMVTMEGMVTVDMVMVYDTIRTKNFCNLGK